MSRRWLTIVVLLIAGLTALACKDTGANPGSGSGSPSPGHSALPSSMVALGDSLTAGFGTCLAPTPCPRNSWSTGTGVLVNSHYRRILAQNPGIRDHARNLASPGARAADLVGQATTAATSPAQYVTILIGANDACRPRVGEMTTTSAFRASVDATLARLKRGMPAAQVLVVSVPDIYRLWQIGHGSALVVNIWAGARVCPSLLANAASGAPADVARRTAVRDRIDAYNRALASACRSYGSRCHYDGGAAHAYSFSLEQLSAIDFFHPNAAGQNELARVTYPRLAP